MTQFVATPTDAGAVLFEVTDATTAGPQRVTRRGANVIATLDQRLDDALAVVRPAAENVLHTFTELGLETVEVEFGLSLDAEAGAFIAKTGVSGHFTITLGWNRPTSTPCPSAPHAPRRDAADGVGGSASRAATGLRYRTGLLAQATAPGRLAVTRAVRPSLYGVLRGRCAHLAQARGHRPRTAAGSRGTSPSRPSSRPGAEARGRRHGPGAGPAGQRGRGAAGRDQRPCHR